MRIRDDLSEIAIGSIGEHYCYADLLAQGHKATMAEGGHQGWDILLEIEDKFYRVQVKTASKPILRGGKKNRYVFNVNRKTSSQRRYHDNGYREFDIVALVGLTGNKIAYIAVDDLNSTSVTLPATTRLELNSKYTPAVRRIKPWSYYTLDRALKTLEA